MQAYLWWSTATIAIVGGMVPVHARQQRAPVTNPASLAQDKTVQTDAPVAVPQSEPPAENGEIVVTGLRASLRSAQALKRNSDAILDAIVAEDIGKLPDNNASDALARVTGVQVTRYNDEATGVQIRGLSDSTTTFNGREIYAAAGRRVELQDFPAGALAGLEVYKSGTPDLIEPGLAGLINVRSRRPFDFTGLEIAGGVRGAYNDQTGRFDPNGNLLVSKRWDTGIGEIGALLNVSYTQAHYRNAVRFAEAGTRTPAGEVETPTATNPNPIPDDVAVTTPGVGSEFVFPVSVGNFYSSGKRSRPAINGSLQWKPSPELELYADGLWLAYRGVQSNEWFSASLEAADASGNRPTLSNVVLVDGEPNKLRSLTRTGGRAPWMYRSTKDDRTDIYQGALGFRWKTDRATVSSDFAYTNANYSAVEYSLDSQFRQTPTLNVAFDVDGGPDFDLGGYDAMNPANYLWRGFYDAWTEQHSHGIQWRGDVDLDTGIGILPKFQFGLRFSDRRIETRNGNRYADTAILGQALSDLPTGNLETVPDGFRGEYPAFRNWMMPSRGSIRSNFAGLRDRSLAALERIVRENPQNLSPAVLAERALQLERFRSAEVPEDPVAGFNGRERDYAAYARTNYAFEVDDVRIDGVLGARIINTDGSYSGISRLVSDAEEGTFTLQPETRRRNYVDLLPSASMRIALTDRFQFRFAYNKTRTRPSFGSLNPSFNITFNDPTGGSQFDAFGSGGNPDLVPLTSTNYDATAEWYFARNGSITGSLFYRDLFGFISSYSREVIDPVYGRLQVTRPENAGGGRIKGAELAVQSFFDFLPGWLSGFGGQANVTYLDGNNQLPSVFGEDAPIVPLTGVSKWTYNITGFYEKGPVSTRISYNRRSNFVNSFNRVPGQAQFAGETTRGVARLDYSLAYTPFENLTLTVDVNNLLAQPFMNYRNFNADQFYPRDVREEGRYYALGARFRF